MLLTAALFVFAHTRSPLRGHETSTNSSVGCVVRLMRVAGGTCMNHSYSCEDDHSVTVRRGCHGVFQCADGQGTTCSEIQGASAKASTPLAWARRAISTNISDPTRTLKTSRALQPCPFRLGRHLAHLGRRRRHVRHPSQVGHPLRRAIIRRSCDCALDGVTWPGYTATKDIRACVRPAPAATTRGLEP